MLAIFTLNETEYIYRICQIFVARFRIWGGLSNALGRLSLPKPPCGAGAANKLTPETLYLHELVGEHMAKMRKYVSDVHQSAWIDIRQTFEENSVYSDKSVS